MYIQTELELLTEVINSLIARQKSFAASDISRYSSTRGQKIPLHIVKDLLQKKHRVGELPNYKSELYRAKSYVDWAYVLSNATYQPLLPEEVAELEHPIELRNTDKDGRLSVPNHFLKTVGLLPEKQYAFTTRAKWLRIGLFGEQKCGNVSKRGEIRINPSTLTAAELGREDLTIACYYDGIEITPQTKLPS